MDEFDAPAYNMAAVTATVALYRGLVRKGVLAREEARQILLDAAISRSIEAEALRQEPGASKTTMEIDDQSVEILKFIAEHLLMAHSVPATRARSREAMGQRTKDLYHSSKVELDGRMV